MTVAIIIITVLIGTLISLRGTVVTLFVAVLIIGASSVLTGSLVGNPLSRIVYDAIALVCTVQVGFAVGLVLQTIFRRR